MPDIVLLYVTAPNDDILAKIGRGLVEEKLAACVNILGQTTSIYRWEGAIEEAQEVAMLVKTSASRAEAATAHIKALHPYSTPAILQIPVEGGFSPFLAWIKAETSA